MRRISTLRALSGAIVALVIGSALGQNYQGEAFSAAKGVSTSLHSGQIVITPTVAFNGSAYPGTFAPVVPNMIPRSAVSICPTALQVSFQIALKYNPKALPSGTSEASLSLWQVIGNEWVHVAGSSVDTVNKLVKGTVGATGTFGILSGTAAPLEGKIYYRTYRDGQATVYRGDPVQGLAEPVSDLAGLTGMFPEAMAIPPTCNGLGAGRFSPVGLDIYHTDPDGSNPVFLAGPFQNIRGASFTPDGLAVYVAMQKPGSSTWNVVKVNVNTGVQTVVAPGGSTAGPQNGGGALAFGDGLKITTINPAGKTVTFNSPGKNDVDSVVVSRDAKTIAWNTKTGEIYTANLDGSKLKRLGTFIGYSIKFSPDAGSLAFQNNNLLNVVNLSNLLQTSVPFGHLGVNGSDLEILFWN